MNAPIVFVAQLGEPGRIWQPVLDRLSPGTVAITYDRRGLGDAPPRPADHPPVTYGVFADELAAELDERGVTGPVVLVGHSIGWLIVRAFAGRYPERVAALVAVDGSIPQVHLHPEAGPVFETGTAEIDVVGGHLEILSATLPAVPAVVVMRDPTWWMPGRPPRHPALPGLWHAYQRLLAEQLDAPLIVAGDAGHQIPSDAPALVAYVAETVPDLDENRITELGGNLRR